MQKPPVNPVNPADGQHVVIANGQRVTGPLSQQAALEEAARRNGVQEAAGQTVPEARRATVKQNLFG